MASLNFITSLSSVLSNRFLEVLPKLKQKTQNRNINGLNGESQTPVTDFCFGITKNRFNEIALSVKEKIEDPSLLEHVWEELNCGRGNSILELKINDLLRKVGLLYDFYFYTIPEEKKLMFNVRVSADLPTQQPTCYKPLFYGPFDPMFEVNQGGYAITCALDNKPVLATWHLANCIGFAAFNAQNRVGILAHIDESADLKDFKNHISKTFTSTSVFTFEYVLTGGYADGTQRNWIQNEIEGLNSATLKFVHIDNLGVSISEDVVQQDSYWTASVRLNRSIALDTGKDSLEAALMSYEPKINPKSSIHQRKGTKKEAENFANNLRVNGKLELAYNSNKISLL